MNLSALILDRKGARSWADLQAASGGRIHFHRWIQMTTWTIPPDWEPTEGQLAAIARALGVDSGTVTAAIQQSGREGVAR